MSLFNLSESEIASRRARVISIIAKLPEASFVEYNTHLSLEVRGKRFGWYMHDHHGDHRLAINCKAAMGENESLAANDPERFHIPKYVWRMGWVGFWLDTPKVEWETVEGILTEAYRLTAPKKLAVNVSIDDIK